MLVKQTEAFRRWLIELRDLRAQRRITARIVRLREAHFGAARSLGAGLSELKIDLGPGYRLYYTLRGQEVIVLLCGGDKASQQRDIARARELMRATEIDDG